MFAAFTKAVVFGLSCRCRDTMLELRTPTSRSVSYGYQKPVVDLLVFR